MPQASDAQRELMEKWFEDCVSDEGPTDFLLSHGFELTDRWTWKLPTPAHSVSCYEITCVEFLVCEWDFGYIESCENFVCLCGDPTGASFGFGV